MLGQPERISDFDLYDSQGRELVPGPFLIDVDIDNELPVENRYAEKLNNAVDVARTTLMILRAAPFKVPDHDIRVFFSGRKGFNIEVRPSSLGVDFHQPVDQQLEISAVVLRELRRHVRKAAGFEGSPRTGNAVGPSVFIDSVYVVDEAVAGDARVRRWCKLRHPYIRLHNSINAWCDITGHVVGRRRLETETARILASDTTMLITDILGEASVTDG